MTTPSAERSLHHCSLSSEKKQPAIDKLITLLKKVCCPVSRRLSVMLEQGDQFLISLIHEFQTSEKTRVAAQKMSKSGFFWNDKKSRFSLIVEQRFKDTSSKPILTEEISLRRNQQLLHEQQMEQNRELREAREKSLNEMEELKRFQGSTFETFPRRKLVEDRDTVLDLTAKIEELQNEINCMKDSRDFQDAESVRSGHSHITSQPLSTPHPVPGGMLSRSTGMPSRREGPPSIWDTHGMSGNVFANPTASSSAPCPQESNPWISNVSEHTSPHVMSESQTPAQDQRCQSGPSSGNSFDSEEGRFLKNYGTHHQRLQILDLHFDKFTTPATFACWKIRFKTEVGTC